MNRRWGIATAALLLPLVGASVAGADVVYQNVNPDWTSFQPVDSGEQIGDDVTLAGTARSVNQFQVVITNQFTQAYTGTFTARFFDIGSDGLPNNQLWQGTVQVTNGQGLEDNRTLTFAVPNVTVPDRFIWSLQADTNLPAPSADGSDGLGLTINAPPQVGSSQDVAYFFDGTSWSTFDYHDSPPPIDPATFEATINAIPEPASLGVLALGGIALLARKRNA